MSLHFVLAPLCLETYSPETAFLYLGIEKSHTGPCLVNRGAAALTGCDVYPRNSGEGWDSTVSNSRTGFTETCFMPKSSVRMDCTERSKSPNLSFSGYPALLNALFQSSIGSCSWRASLKVHHAHLKCIPL